MSAATSLGAILLAGGRATRVDGIDKTRFDVGGRTLLERAIAAARGARATPITVVGPRPDAAASAPSAEADISWVREDPPFGGPAAAVVAALRAWRDDPSHNDAPWTLVLACDLPGAEAAVERLTDAVPHLPADTDGVCLADESSRPQWLTGVYRTASLRRRADALPHDGHDASVRALLDDLAIAVIAAPAAETDDVDTWEDLSRARARAERETEES